MKHTVFIKTNGVKGEVIIDGNKIDGVTGYTITHDAGGLPELTLKLNCDLQVISDDVLIPLPDPWEKFDATQQQNKTVFLIPQRQEKEGGYTDE